MGSVLWCGGLWFILCDVWYVVNWDWNCVRGYCLCKVVSCWTGFNVFVILGVGFYLVCYCLGGGVGAGVG